MFDGDHFTRYYPTVVGVAVGMHFVWAIGIFLDPESVHATGPHALLAFAELFGCGSNTVALICAVVGTLAAIGMVIDGRWRRLAFIAPQHVVLWISSAGAMNAMYLGQFADGVQRTSWFLVVDQCLVILVAIGHLVAGGYLLRGLKHGRE